MRHVIATIGYDTYAIAPEDLPVLLRIAERSSHVERKKDGDWGTFTPSEDRTAFVTDLRLGDVV